MSLPFSCTVPEASRRLKCLTSSTVFGYCRSPSDVNQYLDFPAILGDGPGSWSVNGRPCSLKASVAVLDVLARSQILKAFLPLPSAQYVWGFSSRNRRLSTSSPRRKTVWPLLTMSSIQSAYSGRSLIGVTCFRTRRRSRRR